MSAHFDPAVRAAVRQMLRQILGGQVNLGSRVDGTISVRSRAYPHLLVVPTADGRVVVRDPGQGYPRRTAGHQPVPARACELCDPEFRELRHALKSLGYVDLWDQGK